MSLAAFYEPERLGLSFELFPPKTPAGGRALEQHLATLMDFSPDYVTCTYGAGGSTRDKTLDVIASVKQTHQVPVASHLTCVGSSRDELCAYLRRAAEREVDYIVALRGDPPQGESSFSPAPDGLRYANELVEMIREQFPQFGIAVAGYPETHQEAVSPDNDLENLKRKVDAGGEVVITQLFYDNADFFAFRERYEAAGIRAPLVPGILPVTNLGQIQRIASMCGAKLPPAFMKRLSAQDDEQWQFQVGVEFAIEQVRDLVEGGAQGLHFYVLNKSQATSQVLRALELRGATPA